MSLNDHNRSIVEKLRRSVTAFVAGTRDLDEIQAALESVMHLCEDDGTGIADAVRRAEADIEEIRFTRLRGEQRSAVTFRLGEPLDTLPE